MRLRNGSAPERGDAQRGLAITPRLGGFLMVDPHSMCSGGA